MRVRLLAILIMAVAIALQSHALHAINYHAVVVGVSYYEYPGEHATQYCTRDAEAFRNALIDSLGWNSDNIELFIDYDFAEQDGISGGADKDIIMTAISNMPKGPDDVNLLFFSGHGIDGALKTGDSNLVDPYYDTYITPSELEDSLTVNNFNNFIIFNNSCYAGETADSISTGLVYCSSSIETYDEAIDGAEQTYWVYYLINGLKNITADDTTGTGEFYSDITPDNNHIISSLESYVYASELTYDLTSPPLQRMLPKTNNETHFINLHTATNYKNGGSYEKYASIEDALNDSPSSGDTIYVANHDSISTNITIPSSVSMYLQQPSPDDNLTDLLLENWEYYLNPYSNRLFLKFASTRKLTVQGNLIVRSGDYSDNVILQPGSGVSSWGGIEISSTGHLDAANTEPFSIYNATYGIKTYSSNVDFQGDIYGCGYGVYALNCSPDLEINQCFNSTYKGIYISGSSSDPTITSTRIDTTSVGVQVSNYSDMDLSNSIIRNVDDGIVVYSYGDADLMVGHNDLYESSISNYHIKNYTGSYYIGADYNYWGSSGALSSYFLDASNISLNQPSYTPYTSLSKRAVATPEITNKFIEAREYEKYHDYHVAINVYKSIVDISEDRGEKRRAIKSILKLKQKLSENCSDIRELIISELQNASDSYMASLDYLYCESYLVEKDYNEAINQFKQHADRYDETRMQVEMLTRLANIYGNYLNNAEEALRYANMASTISPGYPIVESAYHSAVIDYNPDDYEDTFGENIDNYGAIEKWHHLPENQEEDSTSTEFTDGITVSPNPFNPSTVLTLSLMEPADVRLDIYSANGQKVKTLVNRRIEAGQHLITFDGRRHASGVYFYKLSTSRFNQTGKLLLMK